MGNVLEQKRDRNLKIGHHFGHVFALYLLYVYVFKCICCIRFVCVLISNKCAQAALVANILQAQPLSLKAAFRHLKIKHQNVSAHHQ